ncbi:BTB/POZ domain protein [Necator americanus]|uniref:BTB/POZ domain protein n=3 Tax=Necator americanus TaxID=51031 RepID=W2T8Y6_NECAM|nr:BTB/POZ domain protein [Necator americanus]ETN77666.1 BTB/POZ domain protein [Necator americanus]
MISGGSSRKCIYAICSCFSEMTEESANFTVENKHRTCRITARGTTFYVNGHFLGEISSFFDVAFFGEFAESREKLIALESETPQDIALFLDIVHPGGKKKVTEKSCGVMMRYSDIWDIPSLRDKCKEFLLYNFPKLRPSFETTLGLLEIAYLHGFENCSDQLISRLAGFGQVFLDQQGMLHKIADARTVAALFSAAPKEKIVVKKFLHCLTSLGNRTSKECVILNCTNRPSHVCSVCKLYLCSSHQDYIPCTKDAQFPNFIKIVPFNIGSAKVDTDLLYGKNSDKSCRSRGKKALTGNFPLE